MKSDNGCACNIESRGIKTYCIKEIAEYVYAKRKKQLCLKNDTQNQKGKLTL